MTLTAQGFKRKLYEDFLSELEQQARELFGADVNLNDDSAMGQWIKMIAFARAEENEQAEAVYLSAFYDSATGISLDYVCKYVGITRIQAQKSKKDNALVLDVEPGTTIPAGFIGATEDGIEFVTTTTLTDSDNDGVIVGSLEALNPGSLGNVPANTITVINTPVVGLNSITNVLPLEGGRERETDAELRNRYALSVAKGGSATLDGIRATLLNDVPGVRAAVLIENDTSVIVDGRPPHSFEAIVLGGEADDIATAILKSKPGGIQAFGTQNIVVLDDSGNPKTIGYSYASEIDVYVNITLSTNAAFPTNGRDMVKLEIVKYIGGLDSDNNVYAGLGMGEDVVLFQVQKAISNVPGVLDATITLSKDNTSFVESNVVIEPMEVAQTTFDKLVIA